MILLTEVYNLGGACSLGAARHLGVAYNLTGADKLTGAYNRSERRLRRRNPAV